MADNSAQEAREAVWCYERRLLGHSLRAIADASPEGLGHKISHETVRMRIEAHLAAEVTPESAAIRQLELDKLDRIESSLNAIIAKHHYVVKTEDKSVICVRDPEADTYLNDDGPALAAFDRLLRVQERRSRLLGLDSPVQVAVDATVRYQMNGVDPQALT